MSTCSACRHHHARPDVGSFGECRRMPPSMPKHAGQAIHRVYDLTADDLPACGEFRQRDEAEPMPEFEAKVELTGLMDRAGVSPGSSIEGSLSGPNPAQKHGSQPRRGKGR